MLESPRLTPHFYRQMLAPRDPFEMESPAVPDCEFRAQEGHHIVGLSRRDGKPMGIIEAPMEASRTKRVSEIVTSATKP